MTNQIITLLLFLGTIGTGVWLHKLGKPFGKIPLSTHKLVSLILAVLVFIIARNLHTNLPLSSTSLILLIVLAIATVAAFATGGIMSARKSEKSYKAILVVHNLATTIIAITLVILFVIH